jgi:recombination protein RecR
MKALSSLPGIGPKSAERIAIHLLKSSETEVREIARLMVEAKEKTFFCETCRNLSTEKQCHICKDPLRDRSLLCVVGDPKDVASIEKTGAYKGIYHVLFGALSPIEGIGPEELKLERLLKRIRDEKTKEVILATNPNTEGDATALYLAECLKPGNSVKVTRIARGVPVGSHLEYVDQATLQRAMEGRAPLP